MIATLQIKGPQVIKVRVKEFKLNCGTNSGNGIAIINNKECAFSVTTKWDREVKAYTNTYNIANVDPDTLATMGFKIDYKEIDNVFAEAIAKREKEEQEKRIKEKAELWDNSKLQELVAEYAGSSNISFPTRDQWIQNSDYVLEFGYSETFDGNTLNIKVEVKKENWSGHKYFEIVNYTDYKPLSNRPRKAKTAKKIIDKIAEQWRNTLKKTKRYKASEDC